MTYCKASRLSGTQANGHKQFQNRTRRTTRQWTNYFKTRTSSSGFGWAISTIPGQRCTFPPDTGKKPCVKPMTAFSGGTTRPTRHTSRSPHRTSGQRWDKTLSDTKTSVYDANKGRNRSTRERHWRHFPFRIVQTSGFTLIFLAQCSQRTVTKNLSFALRTLLPSTLWSLRLPTRKLKRWRMPFIETGSQNSVFRHKYIPTEAKNLSISFPLNYSNSWMSDCNHTFWAFIWRES